MRKKSKQSQPDPLEELRQGWKVLCENIDKYPSLTDEELKALIENYCETHEGEPLEPRRRRRPLVWTQVLSAAVCLCSSVWSVLLCGRLGDDRILRILFLSIAVGGLVLAVHCVYPQASPLFRRYRGECAVDRQPYPSFGIWRVVPVGFMLMVVLVFATRVPVGDGHHITAMGGSRLAYISSVEYLMTQMA